ncbi:MAG: hypothetical protein ACI9MC_002800 [Kiritimatiellia bacterium]|jgi:hypothetical protein
MLRHILPVALLASVGCTPHAVEITSGSFLSMTSLNTSALFVAGKVDMDDFEDTWWVDCRPGVDPVDGAKDYQDLCGEDGVAVDRGDGAGSVSHESWINRDAFHVARETLDPWRAEAIMTSEGDLELTFHHRLPGDDFRFTVVIDPKFAPRTCQESDDGSLAYQPIDGDWVANWSRAMTEGPYNGALSNYTGNGTDGSLYFLNSGSYQFDPIDSKTTWTLSPQMEAGYARGRFSDEEFFVQRPRYAAPSAYIENFGDNGPPEVLMYWVSLDPEEYGGDNFENLVRDATPFKNMMGGVEADAIETQQEVAAIFPSGITPDNYTPIVPSNAWRKPDGWVSGLDGFGELNYSWIRLDQKPEDVGVGNPVSGEFSMWMYGSASQSHIFIQGEFDAPKVKKDRWVTPNVHEDKLIENNTTLCGETWGDGE